MIVLAACLFLSSVLAATEDLHRLAKRFVIYPNNAVIQFALGLGLPAEVRGRNIATNSGILININLPTNLSQLRPPARSVRASPAHSGVMDSIHRLFDIRADNKQACLAKSSCILQRGHQDRLVRDIFKAVVDTVFDRRDKERLFKHRKRRNSELSEEECLDYDKKCGSEFLSHLDKAFPFS